MKKLIHFGCSFAVGNAVPAYMPGLRSGAYVHLKLRRELEKQYNVKINDPTSCGRIIADHLDAKYVMVAENGGSNERIVRKLLQTSLKKSFVLVGLTSYNRREGLTTSVEPGLRREASHWHTWKMVGLEETPAYKEIRFDPWVNKGRREYHPAIEEEGQIRTATQILYMQNYFKANSVPYLMYNALYNGFDDPLTYECKELLSMVDQTRYYKLQGNFNECQHGWSLKNHLVVSELDDHPNVPGQQAWAKQLMPLVEKIL